MKLNINPIWRFALITAFALAVGLVMVQPTLAGPDQKKPDQYAAAEGITGIVTLDGPGLANVVITYTDTTSCIHGCQVGLDSSGQYTILVSPGWSGTVTPSLAGYSFLPTSRTYVNVQADTSSGNDFAGSAFTPTPTVNATITPTRTATRTKTRTPTPTIVKTSTRTPTSPAGFSKLYPWDKTINVSVPQVTLSWRAYSSSFEKYRYCIDKINDNACDSSGGYTSLDKSVTSLTVNVVPDTKYYWHIQAVTCAECNPKVVVDSNGGVWWSFKTGGAPTATPTPQPTRTPTRTPTKTATPFSASFTSDPANDGWVLESGENSGTGGTMNATSPTLPLGDNAANKQYRVILSFDTSSLPDGASIDSVVLKIKQSGGPVGANPFSILGNLWADARNGAFGGDPALQLGDFSAAASGAKVGSFSSTAVGGWYSDTFNSVGRNQINKTGVTQVRLYFALGDNNDRIADYIKFLSGNATSGKPVLTVYYR